MLQSLRRGQPLARIGCQQLRNEVLRIITYAPPRTCLELKLTLTRLLENLCVVCPFEGRCADQENICQDSTAPQVDFRTQLGVTVVLGVRLWSEPVCWRPVGFDRFIFSEYERATEADELDSTRATTLFEIEVLRAKVLKKDVLRMALVNGLEELLHDELNVELGNTVFTRANRLHQLSAFYTFHHNVETALIFEPFTDFLYGRVFQRFHLLEAFLNLFHSLVVANGFLADDFEPTFLSSDPIDHVAEVAASTLLHDWANLVLFIEYQLLVHAL